jgi:hypothetical protein
MGNIKTYNSPKAALALCKALDLDVSRVSSITLTLKAGAVPEVTVGYLVDTAQIAAVADELKSYLLVAKAPA